MQAGLRIMRAGPGLGLQDEGRVGYMSYGMSRGGAVDQIAMAQARALAEISSGPVVELGGGGVFRVEGAPLTLGFAGAEMRAVAGGQPLTWNAAHRVEVGTEVTIAPLSAGGYGYMSVGGGVNAEPVLGSASVHFASRIGSVPEADTFWLAAHPKAGRAGWRLGPYEIDLHAPIRVLPSVQDHLIPAPEKTRFTDTVFRKSHRANRVGVALDYDGDGFRADAHLSITSDVVVPGDVQLVGDGHPYVLFGECQTTGGYPRIATVISADLPRLAQCPAGGALRFEYVTHAQALEARHELDRLLTAIPKKLEPLVRDPRDMPDLGGHQLISGVTATGEEFLP